MSPRTHVPARSIVALGVFLAACVVTAAEGATGGPDVYGITWVDDQDGCPTETWEPGPGAITFDDPLSAVGPFPLGFAMPFAGGVATEAWVSPTGFIAFSDQGVDGAALVTQLVPDAQPPNHLFAPLWRAAFALSVTVEASPGRFDVRWSFDGRFGQEPVFATFRPDGSTVVVWGTSFEPANDSTVGYEDAAGALGSTYWRDGFAVDPGFPPPGAGRSACFSAPTFLDCTAPAVMGCDEALTARLPDAAPRQAEVYSCSADLFPGNERVVRVDVADPTSLTVTLDDPDVRVLRVEAPPACMESRCLAIQDSSMTLPLAVAGSHWFVLDSLLPGGGRDVRVTTTCRALPPIACGVPLDGTTVGAPAAEADYACAPVSLSGAERSYLLAAPAAGHVSVSLTAGDPALWVILRDRTGTCLAAGQGGATAFDVPAAELIVTVDGLPGVASDFSLEVRCGTLLDCAAGGFAACGARVSGDTSTSTTDRVDRYSCAGTLADGAEDAWLLRNPRDQVVAARFLTQQPGQQLFLVDGCDEGRCRLGGTAGDCAFLPAGDYLLVVDGPEATEGPYEIEIECRRVSSPGVDLRLESLDVAAVVTDCRDLDVDSVVEVVIVNDGALDALAPFDVVVFLDDGSGDFEGPPADAELGRWTVRTDVAAGTRLTVLVPVTGSLPFRDAVLHVRVDPEAVVPDTDRGDTIGHSGWNCLGPSPPVELALRQEWAWTGSATAPDFTEVETVPLVTDLDGDGFPEVVFTTEDFDRMTNTGDMIRVVSGRDGAEVWTADDPALRVKPATMLAVGDLEGDGTPEIVGQSHDDPSRLLCLDATGSLLWLSEPLLEQSPFDTWSGAPDIADIDGDGLAEVVWGPNVLNADGTPFWIPESGGTFGSSGGGPVSVVADLTGDGIQEVVAGPTAYQWAPATGLGRILWQAAGIPDGFAAVGNLDDDPMPEVVVASMFDVWVLEGESGAVAWTDALPSFDGAPCGGLSSMAGGPPTIGDIDADGRPEILVMVADWLAAYEGDGTPIWQAPVWECSSGTTSATIFDLEGDGEAEVLLKDQVALRILRARDGVELASVAGDSGTAREMPVVADIDADGQAEIVVVDNRLLGGGVPGGAFGVRAFGSAGTPWQGARSVWNQHAYHVSNVEDDLTLPRPGVTSCLPPSPLAADSFRVQRAEPRPGPLAPDVTLTLLEASETILPDCFREVDVDLRVGNGGGARFGTSVSVAAFDGDPAAGGGLLTLSVVPDLRPGEFTDLRVTVRLPLGAPLEAWIAADDDGTGTGLVMECREGNNTCVVVEDDVAGMPPPRPADVGPALRATGHGDPRAADITAAFDWSLDFGGPRVLGTDVGEEHYHVVRGLLGGGPPVLLPIPGTDPWLSTDHDDSTPRAAPGTLPQVHGYRVFAADWCELESSD